MRTHGTLTKWHDDRGFGFVAPAQGGGEVFVHVSAFPHDGQRPRLGELVSFEIENGPNGKPRAVRVMRPGQRPVPRPHAGRTRPHRSALPWAAIIALVAAGAVGGYGYSRMRGPERLAEVVPADIPARPAAPAPTASRCDGRTMCSEMTSCAEATYFIKHCPNTKMDGDHDGVPCERQLCG